jgi:hypothetical protein
MRQQTTSVTQARILLFILFLFLVLAISFLALANVQTMVPLPNEKIAVALLVRGLLI